MRIITVTSENYVELTRQMLQSLRIWHADLPVTVYALDQGWTGQCDRRLEGLADEVHPLSEGSTRNRGARQDGQVTNYCVWKLDACRQQQEPFILLDGDMLILKPLDPILEATSRDGWFAVHEGTRLGDYAQGEVSRFITVPESDAKSTSFNTGVLGCDMKRHGEVFDLAIEWGRQVSGVWLGDQGLLNLAWYNLRGYLPTAAPTIFNGGWYTDDRLNLTQTVLHFARPSYGGSKLADQTRIWRAWPRGVKVIDLTETDFWQQSLPHPWPWLNQANHPRHRDHVARIRRASRELTGAEYLVIPTADHAFLLDRALLRDTARFWKHHAHRFADVPYRPTYHLAEGGRLHGAASRWWDRCRRGLRAHLPR